MVKIKPLPKIDTRPIAAAADTMRQFVAATEEVRKALKAYLKIARRIDIIQ